MAQHWLICEDFFKIIRIKGALLTVAKDDCTVRRLLDRPAHQKDFKLHRDSYSLVH